jgi:hypothetical protein
MLFTGDTISLCSSLVRSFSITVPCPTNVSSVWIDGTDAASFMLETGAALSLPKDSIVTVRCTPQHDGALAATLHFRSADGRVFDVPLSSFARSSAFTLSRLALFERDTILICKTITDSLDLGVDCPTDSVRLSLEGNDASSFALTGSTLRSVPSDPHVVIAFTPSHIGTCDALLRITLPDARTFVVPLSVFVKDAPLMLSRNSLFDGKAFSICTTTSDSLFVRSDCPLAISSISLGGADASSFAIESKTSFTTDADSLIAVHCSPLRAGKLHSDLIITLSDGSTKSIPLDAEAIDRPTLMLFQPPDLTTDTVGGDAAFRIVSRHTGLGGDAEFRMRFDTATLVYHGTFDESGRDHTIYNSKTGMVQIAMQSETDSVLYAYFSFFPLSEPCANIAIDSIKASASSASCLAILTSSLTSSVCASPECGWYPIANFLRYGKAPKLFIRPNPSRGSITVLSNVDAESVPLSVIDITGIERLRANIKLERGKESALDLGELPSGVYTIHASIEGKLVGERIVIER